MFNFDKMKYLAGSLNIGAFQINDTRMTTYFYNLNGFGILNGSSKPMIAFNHPLTRHVFELEIRSSKLDFFLEDRLLEEIDCDTRNFEGLKMKLFSRFYDSFIVFLKLILKLATQFNKRNLSTIKSEF